MQQIILIVVTGVALSIPTTALLLLIETLFPQIIKKSRGVIEESQGRTFLIGLVNTLFIAALIFLSVFLSQNVWQIFILLGIVSLSTFAIGVMVGFASIAQHIGSRLFLDHSRASKNIRGSLILFLSFLTPVIGWYLFFPYVAILGFGGVVTAWFRKLRRD